MRILLSTSLLVISFIGFTQPETDRSVERELFERALFEYHNFESKVGHYIQTENVNMHYITIGDPSKTPLIWIHGTGSSSWEILDFSKQLNDLGLYIISVDYYGHGQTPMPAEEKSIYHVADDIHFLMEKLNMRKALIGGWSRGGYVASAFYDEYPESVLGLILVDGGSANGLVPRYQMDRDTLRARYEEISMPESLLKTYDSKFEAYCAHVDTKLNDSQTWILDGLKQDKHGKWGYNTEVWPAVANESAEAMLAALESPTLAPMLASSTYLMQPLVVYRNLNVPLLVIDPVSPDETWQDYAEENRKLKALQPDWVTLEVYENTGHAAHFEHPDRFIDNVSKLLEKISEQ